VVFCYGSIARARSNCQRCASARPATLWRIGGGPNQWWPTRERLCGPLRQLLPLEIQQVRRGPQEPLFNSLIEQYHYLGYQQPVGEHLKYLVWAQQRPVACLAWSSSPRHLGARDRYIGWSQPARRRNVHLRAYNTRFLILPDAVTFC
jgi:hypothetical protein